MKTQHVPSDEARYVGDRCTANPVYIEMRLFNLRQHYHNVKSGRVDVKDQRRVVNRTRKRAIKMMNALHDLPDHWLKKEDREIVAKLEDMLMDFQIMAKTIKPRKAIGKPITKGWDDRALSGQLRTLYDHLKFDDEYEEFLSLVLPYFGIKDPSAFARIPPLE